MTFTVNSVTVCPGGNHVTISTTAGTVRCVMEELTAEPVGEYREPIIARIRSAIKESAAPVPVQLGNLLPGKTYKV